MARDPAGSIGRRQEGDVRRGLPLGIPDLTAQIVRSRGGLPSSIRCRLATALPVRAAGDYFGLRCIRTMIPTPVKQKPPTSAGHGLRRGALAVMKNAVTASRTPAMIRSQPKARIILGRMLALSDISAQSSFGRQGWPCMSPNVNIAKSRCGKAVSPMIRRAGCTELAECG
jgi:hypothetical protein